MKVTQRLTQFQILFLDTITLHRVEPCDMCTAYVTRVTISNFVISSICPILCTLELTLTRFVLTLLYYCSYEYCRILCASTINNLCIKNQHKRVKVRKFVMEKMCNVHMTNGFGIQIIKQLNLIFICK